MEVHEARVDLVDSLYHTLRDHALKQAHIGSLKSMRQNCHAMLHSPNIVCNDRA